MLIAVAVVQSYSLIQIEISSCSFVFDTPSNIKTK